MKTFNKILLGIGLVSLTYSCTDLEEDLVGDLTTDFTVGRGNKPVFQR